MTEETAQLFDAPWSVISIFPGYDIITSGGKELFAHAYTEENAHRLARLPELYDALMETVYYKCFECMGGLRHNIDLTQKDLIENGCPKQNKSNVCIYVKHIDLLRKVRDGK